MHRECRERFPAIAGWPSWHSSRHVRDRTCRDACQGRQLAVSFVGGGENVPGIPGACVSRNFAYLVRDPYCQQALYEPSLPYYSLFSIIVILFMQYHMYQRKYWYAHVFQALWVLHLSKLHWHKMPTMVDLRSLITKLLQGFFIIRLMSTAG